MVSGKLPESDSGHAIRVLRLHAGDTVHVVDGAGNAYLCRLDDENHHGARVTVLETTREPAVWSPAITVLVAPTKQNERMEWLLEKLVEVGIDRFVPVRCARSERKELKMERMERIAVSAMKQSLKATLPELVAMTPLKQAVEQFRFAQNYVGYCSPEVQRRALAAEYRPDKGDAALLIGPEGDFTPEEIDAVIQAGFMPVTLGDTRLRTETAALDGTITFHVLQQFFNANKL